MISANAYSQCDQLRKDYRAEVKMTTMLEARVSNMVKDSTEMKGQIAEKNSEIDRLKSELVAVSDQVGENIQTK